MISSFILEFCITYRSLDTAGLTRVSLQRLWILVIRFKRSALIRVFFFPSYFLDRNRHGLRSTRTCSNCRCNNFKNWNDMT